MLATLPLMPEFPARPPVTPWFDVRRDADGVPYIAAYVRGIALLRFVLTNKGTGYTRAERVALGLDGLLPSAECTLEEQIERAWLGYRRQGDDLSRHTFLRGLQERQEILFYAFVAQHLEEMLPIIYTPTVGEAVERFSHIFENPRGLSVHPENVDRCDALMGEYPLGDVRLVVATDSSAILGIGDQGYGGLAIPIGKLSLYTVAGGVSPFHTMPTVLDVGTDRIDLIEDPLYLGARVRRLRGDAYLAFLDRYVTALRTRWPRAILQWEDLAKETAFTVLERYRDVLPSFNDDIQGTGAVALAGLRSACRLKGEAYADQVFVVHGAGAGGIGVAAAIRDGLMHDGLTAEQAYARIWVLDSRGLMIDDGTEMPAYKKAFARNPSDVDGWTFAGPRPDLRETVAQCGATALLGLSGQAGAFDADVVRAVCAHTDRPIVFPLSNPTKSSEARPAEVLAATEGRAIIATGSPFDAVALDGRVYEIGQGNNAFVFPGIGLGAMVSGARRISDTMILAGALALEAFTAASYPDRVYPPVKALRDANRCVAIAVAQAALDEGLAAEPMPCGVEAAIDAEMWEPRYLPIRPA